MNRRRRLLWAALASTLAMALAWSISSDTDLVDWSFTLSGQGSASAFDKSGGVRIRYAAIAADPDADAMAETARVLEQRTRRNSSASRVTVDGDVIQVALARVDTSAAESLAYRLLDTGSLRIVLVDNDAPFMHKLCAAVRDSPRSETRESNPIECTNDVWTGPYGRDERDVYLQANERRSLEAFIERTRQRTPDLPLAPSRSLVYERVAPREGAGPLDAPPQQMPYWRTYYVHSTNIVQADDIADAYVTLDQYTGQPAIIATLHDDGARRFATATSEHVGKRLAIAIGDTVLSAPSISSPISGGQFMLQAGAGSPASKQLELDMLHGSLFDATPAALPLKLQVQAIDPIPRTLSDADVRNAKLVWCLVIGVCVFVLVLLVASRIPPLSSSEPTTDPGQFPIGRLLVTFGAGMFVYLSLTIWIPFISEDELLALLGDVSDADTSHLSVFALGISPIVSAFVLVELAALAVPRWRGHRHSPTGRARMLTWIVVLSLALALLHGYTVALWLASSSYGPYGAMSSMDTRTIVLTTMTLAAGVMVMWLVVAAVSRYGLGNGISVVLLAGFLIQGVHLFEPTTRAPLSGADTHMLIGSALVLVLTTTWLLRLRVGGDRGLRLPTGGVIPIVETTGLFVIIASIPYIDESIPIEWQLALSPLGNDNPPMFIALLVALTVGFALVFSRPSLSDPDHRPSWSTFWLATGVSGGFLVLISIGPLWLARPDMLLIDALMLVIGTAIVMDITAEIGARRRHPDLVSIWPLHRVQHIDSTLASLRDASIPAFARGRYHRTLLYFFGPYIPIQIMVPNDQSERARALLTERAR